MSGMAVSVVGVKKQGRYSMLCSSDIQTGCRAGDKAVHLILKAWHCPVTGISLHYQSPLVMAQSKRGEKAHNWHQ